MLRFRYSNHAVFFSFRKRIMAPNILSREQEYRVETTVNAKKGEIKEQQK